jgi:MshEN domain
MSTRETDLDLPRQAPVVDMRDIPLGTLVHRAGLLTADQLEAALAEGSETGRRLGEILIARGLLEERQVASLIAGQKGLPFVELHPDAVDPSARGVLPTVGATRYGAIAIAVEDGVPVVAIADPANDAVVAFIEDHLGSRYRLVVAPRAQIERAALGKAPGAPWQPVAVPKTTFTRVVLRLVNGEELELGSYVERAEADAAAARFAEQFAADELRGWLAVDGRYVRPGAILSLDVV